ncbi:MULTISPECIES: 3-hydroxyacyl-ACP dehydratase [Sphingobacterium]|uniref:3-hydroxyacyl-ACP dehydratase n=1 Tax=Sphingobacterium TaxID=28453 RepID=UPI0013D9B52C|nr:MULTISPECIES: 3-hydroxyacyl-ACP dehydratase [unclassified Sphingobacterium]
MLLQNFYTVDSLQNLGGDKYVAAIALNKHHTIFKGHFPDQPVTPGVCMMQIVKELSEQILQKKLFMYKSSNVKFMALINPEVNADLRLEIDISGSDESDYKVKNVTYFEDTVALKLVCTFKVK